jgi:drug/metabolite transporter (DMT)-like permease
MSPAPTAALWMTGAVVSFSSMAVAGRAVSVELDTFEIMMYRSFVGIILVLSTATFLGRLSEVRTHRLPAHIGRNIAHFTGQNLWFYALTLIPLAPLFALEFTTPIWVALMSPFVLGERLTRTRVLLVLLGFAGVLLVARPGTVPLGPGLFAALGSAVAFAATFLFTKSLTRTESVVTILIYLTVLQAIFGVVMAGLDGDIAVPSTDVLPGLLVIGCAGLLAHLCITSALKIAPASIVAPMDFVRLPVIAVVGATLFAEPLDPFVLLGAAVIFAANYLNILWSSKG